MKNLASRNLSSLFHRLHEQRFPLCSCVRRQRNTHLASLPSGCCMRVSPPLRLSLPKTQVTHHAPIVHLQDTPSATTTTTTATDDTHRNAPSRSRSLSANTAVTRLLLDVVPRWPVSAHRQHQQQQQRQRWTTLATGTGMEETEVDLVPDVRGPTLSRDSP